MWLAGSPDDVNAQCSFCGGEGESAFVIEIAAVEGGLAEKIRLRLGNILSDSDWRYAGPGLGWANCLYAMVFKS